MTGAGSGYIDNGCVLNPFAGIPLYIFMALSLLSKRGPFPFVP